MHGEGRLDAFGDHTDFFCHLFKRASLPETEPARRSGLEKRELLNVRQIIRPDNDIKIYHKNASAI